MLRCIINLQHFPVYDAVWHKIRPLSLDTFLPCERWAQETECFPTACGGLQQGSLLCLKGLQELCHEAELNTIGLVREANSVSGYCIVHSCRRSGKYTSCNSVYGRDCQISVWYRNIVSIDATKLATDLLHAVQYFGSKMDDIAKMNIEDNSNLKIDHHDESHRVYWAIFNSAVMHVNDLCDHISSLSCKCLLMGLSSDGVGRTMPTWIWKWMLHEMWLNTV